MKLSIIIPTLNEAERISQLLLHFKTHLPADEGEIIVVNAPKTTDRTGELAKLHGATVITADQSCRATQMNCGARYASGTVLYFVHADVLPPPSFYQDISKAIEQKADFGWFSYRFDSTHPLLRYNARYTKKDGFFAGGGDQTLFIKKKIFEQMGGFREDYLIMEDFELTKRLKKKGYFLHIIPNDAQVSARKYERNSYFKVNLVNLLMFVLFWLKCPQPIMVKTYRSLLNR
ncbi:MAG TPA: TIGR04283 family arsenosugar biosynthesis glycosyltransferase [Saprospiraceae bacterium]|nr:TIGR04283 family arsenosugar biosynthesis glycosyltransferase [Saprospiraceae bacterium]HMQ82725.1 TIGR04283 family arsenosugar biosynthesis glycosyltransferase [Saprospiraceae bacterium]